MGEEEKLEYTQFEGLIEGLMDNGFGCCNDFLSTPTIVGLRANVQALMDAEAMRLSGIGTHGDYQKDTAIRGDKIHWIADFSSNPFEVIYLQKIANLIAHLNKTCFTSLRSFESHYSSYEQKCFYKRHIDQFKVEKGRQFSIVLYLNENWKPEDGGLLSMYPKGKQQIDLSPEGGRIVLFRSDEMEHEVHASFTRERRSIAGWLKN